MRRTAVAFLVALFSVDLVGVAAAQVVNPPSQAAATPGGDLGGTSVGAAVVKKVNGNTPGGFCASGQFPNGIDTSGRPINCLVPSGTTSGFGLGSITPPTGRYYPFFGEIYFPGAQFSANTLTKCHPVVAIRNQTATGLAGSVATAATGNFALALYNISADGTRATTLIANTGSLSTASAVQVSGSFASPVAVTANTLYELCAQMDNTNAAMTSAGTSVAQLSGFSSIGSAPKSSNTGYMGISYSGQTFGTWPDLTNASFTEIASGGAPAGFLVQQ